MSDTDISDLTDDELAAALVCTYGVTEAKARTLVEVHRGRLKPDLHGGGKLERITIRDLIAKSR